MNEDIKKYNQDQSIEDNNICNVLADTIDQELTLADSKIWHAHPVWFLEGNPIVGYSKQKSIKYESRRQNSRRNSHQPTGR